MKIILTGATGFIGSCFLWQLNAMGIDDVFLVDVQDHPEDLPNLKKKKFKAYLSREELLVRLNKGQLREVDGVIHLGACSDTKEHDWDYLLRNNIEYSKTIARWTLRNKKFLHYASSAAIYGDGKQSYSDQDGTINNYAPLNFYGKSKWIFDQWVISEKLTNRVVGYRFFNVFGPNEQHKGDMKSMVAKAFSQIQVEGKAKLFATTREGFPNGSEERDFVYVKDVNKVMMFFLEHLDQTGIFNVGSGQPRTFRDLVTAVFSALGRNPEIEYIPMPDSLQGQYQYFTKADISKLRKAGYAEEFYPLEEAIGDYVKNHLAQTDPTL